MRRVSLIPHTAAATRCATRVGVEVNLEADLIAKYVTRRLLVRPGSTRVSPSRSCRSGVCMSDTKAPTTENAAHTTVAA